jgi:hypothetical protein
MSASRPLAQKAIRQRECRTPGCNLNGWWTHDTECTKCGEPTIEAPE